MNVKYFIKVGNSIMENEVSGIAKLGIVLIALAVLIGLGFGIFQISKSVANDGVGDVQAELDSVAQSAYTTYDQTTITGTMAASAVSDFEGESAAVLIATQAWINALADNGLEEPGDLDYDDAVYAKLPGISQAYTEDVFELPVVWAFAGKALEDGSGDGEGVYNMNPSKGGTTPGAFINYNTLIGNGTGATGAGSSASAPEGCVEQMCNIDGTEVFMAGIYFDNNCFRCTSGFATNASGRVLANNITQNLSKTGRVEFIPSGAKFSSFLIKDASGTTMGMAFTQLGAA